MPRSDDDKLIYQNLSQELEKINDTISFSDSPGQENTEYFLYGIVIHKGTNDAGHYYCYIRASEVADWYLFNDSTTKKLTKFNIEEEK